MTAEEYLALERQSEEKHEFLEGEMFAMSGASAAHNDIVWNLAGILHAQLRGRPCRASIGDMRLQVTATGLYTYPDIVVVCGERRFAELDSLINPTLIIEVLSPSTEAYDRGKKFGHYRTIESLQEVVLVSQDRVGVERFSRQPQGDWLLSEAKRLEECMSLPSIGCELPLAAAGLRAGLRRGRLREDRFRSAGPGE
jgi:Uma2 family endonuclease